MVPSIDRIIGQVPGFVKAHRSTLCRPVVTGGHQEPVHDTDLWVRRDIYKEVLPVSSPFSSGDAGGQVRPLLRGRLPAGRLAVTTVGLSPPSTTTVLARMALLADNGGNTKPLEGQ